MKNLKNRVRLLMLTALLTVGTQAWGKSICYVYLNGPCKGSGLKYSYKWLEDIAYPISGQDASHCMVRAQEFKRACSGGVKGLEVYTAFQVDGINRIIAATKNDGRVYLYSGQWTYMGLHD